MAHSESPVDRPPSAVSSPILLNAPGSVSPAHLPPGGPSDASPPRDSPPPLLLPRRGLPAWRKTSGGGHETGDLHRTRPLPLWPTLWIGRPGPPIRGKCARLVLWSLMRSGPHRHAHSRGPASDFLSSCCGALAVQARARLAHRQS